MSKFIISVHLEMRIFVQDHLSGVAFGEDGRHVEKITTPLKYRDRQAYKLIFRELFFEHNPGEIGSAPVKY